MGDTEFLEKTILFKNLSEQELAKVDRVAGALKLGAEQVVFEEGAPGDSLYIIRSGSVRVTKVENGDEKVLAILRQGDHFGEIALVDNQPRSATIVANEDAELIRLKESDFRKLLEEDSALALKFYKTFAEVLASRLRNTNESLTFCRTLAEGMGG